MNKVTIYDVAGAAGVSLATVSRALNNPEKVKPETRDKVLRVIKELGYKPNAFAKGLASRKSTIVAVMVPDLSRASVAEMVNGIADIAKVYEYSLLLYRINADTETDIFKDVVAAQADGILFLNDEINEEQYLALKEIQKTYQLPVVLANTLYPSDMNLTAVSIDYEKAAYEVTKELIKEGRKKIVLLSTIRKYMVNDLKEAGYSKAMNDFGLEPNIFRTSGDININTNAFVEYIKNNEFDGVIAVRDSIAISFMNILIKSGKMVPDDVSIFGFQNTKYTQLCRPMLSSVDIPIYEIGALAMRILTTEMTQETSEEKGLIKLPHSIVKRDTTK